MDVGSFLNSLGEAHDRREADVVSANERSKKRKLGKEETNVRKGICKSEFRRTGSKSRTVLERQQDF